jgi:hypothetical protein
VTPHRATPEQWVNLERRQLGGNDLVCAVLELRARVEALEAAQQQPEPIDEEENDRRFHACMDLIHNATPEQIRASAGLPERSSLVERVADALCRAQLDSPSWEPEARAAIGEVAGWLSRESDGHLGSGAYWAQRLQREAER